MNFTDNVVTATKKWPAFALLCEEILPLLTLTYVLLSCGSVVEFASSSDMKNVIEKLNDTELNGRHITISEDRGRDSGSRRRRR